MTDRRRRAVGADSVAATLDVWVEDALLAAVDGVAPLADGESTSRRCSVADSSAFL